MAVFDFIETWYDLIAATRRDYRSQIDYEKSHSAEAGYRSPTPSTESG